MVRLNIEKKGKKVTKIAHAPVEVAKVGTIVIVLRGEHKGHRAVVTKNLSSK